MVVARKRTRVGDTPLRPGLGMRGGSAVLHDIGLLGSEAGGEVVTSGTIGARDKIQIVSIGRM